MRFSLLSLGALIVLPAGAAAQGRLVPTCMQSTDGPRTAMACPAQVVRTLSDVQARLDGRVLHYRVTEAFTNRGARIGEADYLYPLPAGAAFRNLRLSINGQMVAGETMDAVQARGVYEEIVRRLRDPALVEWMGAGLLRARIFPIQAGETRTVELEFDAVAPREGDALRVDYARQGDQTSDARFTLVYPGGDAYGRAYSPVGQVALDDSAGLRVARVAGAATGVTILVPVHTGNRAGITVLTHPDGRTGGFAMITISPPETREAPVARDVTFVVDVSGSMSGRKMEQARAAGVALLRTLRPSDRFRLVSFSNGVDEFQPGFVPAAGADLRNGIRFLQGLTAQGGTNIGAALAAALRPAAGRDSDDGEAAGPWAPGAGAAADNERLQIVVFLTDGMPTVGETNADRIAERAEQLRGQARLFTFGLGADVNSALLERLALDGRGTSQFVRPEEDVERMVGVLAQRLSDPVATDVRVRVDGREVTLRDMAPRMPMDLFAGQDLVVLARYTGSGAARVTVEGQARGRAVRWTGDAQFADTGRENAFIPRLWAAQRIGYLSAERRRNGGNVELDGEIRALGERYGIPTEFTSYLVQEPRPVVGVFKDGRPVPPMNSVGSAGAPQSAEASFEAARLAAAQRQVMNTAALDSLALSAGASQAQGARVASGHTFTLRDGVWTDAAYHDSTRTVRVQAFSQDYFALLARLPELRAMAALGEHVLAAGRGVNVEFVTRAPALGNGGVDRVVRNW